MFLWSFSLLLSGLFCCFNLVSASQQVHSQQNTDRVNPEIETALEVLVTFKPVMQEYPQLANPRRAHPGLTLAHIRYAWNPNEADRARLISEFNVFEEPFRDMFLFFFRALKSNLDNTNAVLVQQSPIKFYEIFDEAAETPENIPNSGLLMLLKQKFRHGRLPNIFITHLLYIDSRGQKLKNQQPLQLDWPQEIAFQASRSVRIKYLKGEFPAGNILYVREDYLWWHHERLPGLNSPWQRTLYEVHSLPQTTTLINPEETSKLVSMEALWEALWVTSDPLF